jgi:hypothetical protein
MNRHRKSKTEYVSDFTKIKTKTSTSKVQNTIAHKKTTSCTYSTSENFCNDNRLKPPTGGLYLLTENHDATPPYGGIVMTFKSRNLAKARGRGAENFERKSYTSLRKSTLNNISEGDVEPDNPIDTFFKNNVKQNKRTYSNLVGGKEAFEHQAKKTSSSKLIDLKKRISGKGNSNKGPIILKANDDINLETVINNINRIHFHKHITHNIKHLTEKVYRDLTLDIRSTAKPKNADL